MCVWECPGGWSNQIAPNSALENFRGPSQNDLAPPSPKSTLKKTHPKTHKPNFEIKKIQIEKSIEKYRQGEENVFIFTDERYWCKNFNMLQFGYISWEEFQGKKIRKFFYYIEISINYRFLIHRISRKCGTKTSKIRIWDILTPTLSDETREFYELQIRFCGKPFFYISCIFFRY